MIDGNETYIESLPESGMPVYANEDLSGEFTNSKYTKRLRNKKHDKFYAKMKLAKSLDELVKIATGRNWEKAIHAENKDAKYGIYKYKSRFAFPNINDMGEVKSVSAYTCDVLIINASNGKKYLYDVLNIKEDVASADELLKKELARAKNAQAGDISNNNYTQKNGNVNRNSRDIFTKADEDYMKAVESGDMETAQRMVEEAARAAGFNSPLLYHGTGAFGFTEFDLSKSDDGRTIFLTSNEKIASTYSGVTGTRKVSDVYDKEADKMSLPEISDALNEFVNETFKDAFEEAAYNYSSYDEKKLDKLVADVDKGLKDLGAVVDASCYVRGA